MSEKKKGSLLLPIMLILLIATFLLGVFVGISGTQQSTSKQVYPELVISDVEFQGTPDNNPQLLITVGNVTSRNVVITAVHVNGFENNWLTCGDGFVWADGGLGGSTFPIGYPWNYSTQYFIELITPNCFHPYNPYNFTATSPAAPIVPIIPNMTSTVFSKLDGSYVYWSFSTEPSVPDYLSYEFQVIDGRGNDTEVILTGFIPTRVDVTFFNGTDIATTSYYPSLQYWTDPKIAEGTL